MRFAEMTDTKIWKTFSLNVSLVILLVILGIFIGLFLNNKRLIETGLSVRAQAHFTDIVLTRRWNASYGGVYVEKKPGVVSNPYLVNPDIETIDGRIYTKKNPALMTREISEIAKKDGTYQYHITSLKPLNPNNLPDDFERVALASFEKGEKEAIVRHEQGDRVYFRYMAPLFVEESCLQCHAQQGYKKGDVRGGISVTFEMTDIKRALDLNRSVLIGLYLATVAVLLGIIYFFILKLMSRLSAIQHKITEMAITDELTELYNRRHFYNKLQEEFSRARRHHSSFSCLMIDIDFFKKVNDTYGHQAGDAVLKDIAQQLKNSCRVSDMVARYGGEEFIQLLPDTGQKGAGILAEKIRMLVEAHEILVDGGICLRMTVSIGVASIAAAELDQFESVDRIIQLADSALYQAKINGRNRVEFA